MNISGNTVLITGGGSGIGKALAIRFLDRGNEVIVCGRRDDVLAEFKSERPQIHTHTFVTSNLRRGAEILLSGLCLIIRTLMSS